MSLHLTRKLAAVGATLALAVGIGVTTLTPAHAAMTTFSYKPSVSCLDDTLTPAGYAGYSILTVFQYTSDFGNSSVILMTSGFSTYNWNNGWQLRRDLSSGPLMVFGLHAVDATTYYWNGRTWAYWNTFNGIGGCF